MSGDPRLRLDRCDTIVGKYTLLNCRWLIGCLHFLVRSVNPAKADDFLVKMNTGQDLNDTHPLLHLRNRMTMAAQTKSKKKAADTLLHIVPLKAINAYLQDVPVTRLYASKNEPLPQGIGFEDHGIGVAV